MLNNQNFVFLFGIFLSFSSFSITSVSESILKKQGYYENSNMLEILLFITKTIVLAQHFITHGNKKYFSLYIYCTNSPF